MTELLMKEIVLRFPFLNSFCYRQTSPLAVQQHSFGLSLSVLNHFSLSSVGEKIGQTANGRSFKRQTGKNIFIKSKVKNLITFDFKWMPFAINKPHLSHVKTRLYPRFFLKEKPAFIRRFFLSHQKGNLFGEEELFRSI